MNQRSIVVDLNDNAPGKSLANVFEIVASGEYLIEEFIEGPEYSIEAAIFKGETTIT